MKSMTTLLLFKILSVLACGLLAGLFYGYSCSVNQGLGNLSNEKYLEAFQSINRAIQNPVFFLSFMGSLVFLIITTYLQYRNGMSSSFYCLAAATAIYAIAVFGITVVGNVPLNEQLDKFVIASASPEEISAMRNLFEKPWNNYHTTRTIASILSFVLAILSLLKS
jgi:uncharacterized membrane protein